MDDSLSIQKMCTMMLKRQGHTITTADNGAEALQQMSKTLYAAEENARFDVVLMDLQMPIMDGLESTSRLRKLESVVNSIQGSGSTPKVHQLIIGCSANSDNETMQAAFVAGIDAFIPKPFNIQSFCNTYEKHKCKHT